MYFLQLCSRFLACMFSLYLHLSIQPYSVQLRLFSIIIFAFTESEIEFFWYSRFGRFQGLKLDWRFILSHLKHYFGKQQFLYLRTKLSVFISLRGECYTLPSNCVDWKITKRENSISGQKCCIGFHLNGLTYIAIDFFRRLSRWNVSN